MRPARYRSRATAAVLTALVVLSPIAVRAGADGDEIVVSVATDFQQYGSGDPVAIAVSLCNPTENTITVPFPCPCCHFSLSILDGDGMTVSDFAGGCVLVPSSITWQPGECKLEDYEWSQTTPGFDSDTLVDDGYYSVLYEWRPPGSVTEANSPSFLIGGLVAVPAMSSTGAVILACLVCAVALLMVRRRRTVRTSRPSAS